MFGKKKQPRADFEEQVRAAKYGRIYQTLKDILKVEVKTTDGAGREKIDYAATCAAMKTRARIALDFVDDLEKGS